MAKHGFAMCLLGARWTFLSPTHDCQQHQAAGPEIVAARVKWDESRRSKRRAANERDATP
jgi:hypothetical protein